MLKTPQMAGLLQVSNPVFFVVVGMECVHNSASFFVKNILIQTY